MKTKNNYSVFFLSSLFALTFFFFFAENSFSQTEEKPAAVITQVVKKAEYTPPGDEEWTLAEIAVKLNENYKLKTEAKALAVVKFSDNSILRVRENSQLVISARDAGNKSLDKEVTFTNGRTNFEVKNQGDGSFKFTTPTAVASIRGTDGSIGVGDDGSTLLIINNGLVEIEALLGQQQSGNVEGGNSAFVSQDGEVTIYNTTEEEKEKLKGDQKENVRSLIIKTKDGQQVKIDYYGD